MNDRDALLRLEEALFAAIREKDETALRAVLARGFVFRSHDGTRSDTDGFVRAILSIPAEILSIRGEHLNVDFIGDTAVLTGLQIARVRLEDGNEMDSVGAFSDVCVREDGAWKVAMAWSVEIGGEPTNE